MLLYICGPSVLIQVLFCRNPYKTVVSRRFVFVKLSISVSESLVCRVNPDLNKQKKKFSSDGHMLQVTCIQFSVLYMPQVFILQQKRDY